MFLFFPEHIHKKKKKIGEKDFLNMIEIKYRDNCIKLRKRG